MNEQQAIVKSELIKGLVDEYGTPIYIYDGNIIESKYNRLKNILPDGVRIYYSIKANPLIGIGGLLNKLGSGAEIASDGELDIALESGFTVDNTIFSGPGKTKDELEYAVSQKVSYIMVESFDEIKYINEISCKLKVKTKIGIRVNPDSEVNGSAVVMGGLASQFGIDEKNIEKYLQDVMKYSNIDLCALHIYMGSQTLDAQQIIHNVKTSFRIYKKLKSKFNINIKLLDMGGGFGVPYFSHEVLLDEEYLKQGLIREFDNLKMEVDCSATQFAFESGRYLLAESGVYVTKVLYKKESKGTKFIIVDGGSHHHAASAFLGRFVRHNFDIRVIGKSNINSQKAKVCICGKLCTPTDIIAKDINMIVPNIDDLIVIEKSGAYGLSMSPVLFLSNKMPREVLFYKGRSYLLRDNCERKFFINLQKPAPDIYVNQLSEKREE